MTWTGSNLYRTPERRLKRSMTRGWFCIPLTGELVGKEVDWRGQNLSGCPQQLTHTHYFVSLGGVRICGKNRYHSKTSQKHFWGAPESLALATLIAKLINLYEPSVQRGCVSFIVSLRVESRLSSSPRIAVPHNLFYTVFERSSAILSRKKPLGKGMAWRTAL